MPVSRNLKAPEGTDRPEAPDDRPSTLHEGEASYMKLVISDAIRRNNSVMSRAAVDLGISRATLYRRIAKYGIEVQGPAPVK